jgi:beta-lactamase class D
MLSLKMDFRSLFLFCFLITTHLSAQKSTSAQTDVRPDFNRYFKDCGVEGSIVIYDSSKKRLITNDAVAMRKEALPASSFKVINLLIALETGVIKDENEIIKWPGKTDTTKYGYRPEIYHDITVKEAFEVSAGWAFVELSKRIEKKRYKTYLSKCGYGNLNIDEAGDDFWNFGSFGISAFNQVEFLQKLDQGKVPFSERSIGILKKVMMTETGDQYLLRSKTGWTRADNINTGWWVGWIENPQDKYFFATRLSQDRKFNRPDFGSCRKEITKSVLRDLGIPSR